MNQKHTGTKTLGRWLLQVATLLLPAAVLAQPLHLDSTSEWGEEYWRFEGLEAHHLLYTIQVAGDTTIQGLSYHQLRQTGTNSITPLIGDPPSPTTIVPIDSYVGAVRVDSAASRWWVVLPGAVEEVLLYRFDLEVGETVEGTYGACGGAPIVTDIDAVWFHGRAHRRFILDGGFRYLIEGVGASSGLLGHLCQFFEEYGCLQAYAQGDEHWHVRGCEAIATGVAEAVRPSTSFSIFPNPSDGDRVALSFPADMPDGTPLLVRVLDLRGRTVMHQRLVVQHHRASLQLAPGHPSGALTNGTYMFCVSHEGEPDFPMWTGKLNVIR